MNVSFEPAGNPRFEKRAALLWLIDQKLQRNPGCRAAEKEEVGSRFLARITQLVVASDRRPLQNEGNEPLP